MCFRQTILCENFPTTLVFIPPPPSLQLNQKTFYANKIRVGNPPNFWTGLGFLQKCAQKCLKYIKGLNFTGYWEESNAAFFHTFPAGFLLFLDPTAAIF